MITPTKSTKQKITVSVDAELLHIVDSYVQNSDESCLSRSSIFEQALNLWKQSMRDKYDEHYFSRNTADLKDEAWSAIMTESAKRLWDE